MMMENLYNQATFILSAMLSPKNNVCKNYFLYIDDGGEKNVGLLILKVNHSIPTDS